MPEPTITTSTFRERRVSLCWTPENAPIMSNTWSEREGALTYLAVYQEQGREPRIANATGRALKKDGTPGIRTMRFYVGNLDRLPDEARIAALDALKGVSF